MDGKRSDFCEDERQLSQRLHARRPVAVWIAVGSTAQLAVVAALLAFLTTVTTIVLDGIEREVDPGWDDSGSLGIAPDLGPRVALRTGRFGNRTLHQLVRNIPSAQGSHR
jgi:topoisomerase IA-like protein